jgi:hypothetical protein
MTNSATSTEPAADDARGTVKPWHFFVMLSMVGATAVVLVTPHTHPAALLLLSAAIISAGFVAVAIAHAVSGFLQGGTEPGALLHVREDLLRDKARALRAIKELEFDRAMRKIDAADFADLAGRLRARAMALMQELDRLPETAGAERPRSTPTHSAAPTCGACGTGNDSDARFCKACGTSLEAA